MNIGEPQITLLDSTEPTPIEPESNIDKSLADLSNQPEPTKPKQPKIHINPEVMDYEWRTGRIKTKEAKTVYAQLGDEPSKNDIVIGHMLTPKLAEMVVKDHNGWLD